MKFDRSSWLVCIILLIAPTNYLLGQRSPNPTSGCTGQTPNGAVNFHSNMAPGQVDYWMTGLTSCGTGIYFFDDGHFAYGPNQVHTYEKKGTYHPQIFAAEGYSTSPPLRAVMPNPSGAVQVTQGGGVTNQGLIFAQNMPIAITQSWDAANGHDIIYVVGFRHPDPNHNKMLYGDISLELPNGIQNPSIFGKGGTQIIHNNWASISSTNNNIVRWNFHLLKPNETRYLYVKAEVNTSNLGLSNPSLTVKADIDFQNYPVNFEETSYTKQVTKHPHDPNLIRIEEPCVSANQNYSQILNYYIKFRNQGTGPAQNVRVEIDLGPHIDPNSFQLTNLNPRITQPPTLLPNGFIEVRFDGINLPGTREVPFAPLHECEEEFTFSVCTEDQLQASSPILSTADVFFDNLAPINTGFDTRIPIDFCQEAVQCNQSGDLPPGGDTDPLLLTVSPNPFSTHFLLEYEVPAIGSDVQIYLLDMNNQAVGSPIVDTWQDGGTHEVFYDTSDLYPGIYYISAIIGDQFETMQLIKM